MELLPRDTGPHLVRNPNNHGRILPVPLSRSRVSVGSLDLPILAPQCPGDELQRGGADEPHQSRESDSPLEGQPKADRASTRRFRDNGARMQTIVSVREKAPANSRERAHAPFAVGHFWR